VPARRFAVLLLLMMLLSTACHHVDELETSTHPTDEPFQIGITSEFAGIEDQLNLLESALNETLPFQVKISVYPETGTLVDALAFDHIQMAYLGPTAYVIARERSELRAILTHVVNDKAYFRSYIVTHSASPWNTLEELARQANEIRFAFGPADSLSGMLVPALELKKRGVYTDEEHAFQAVLFADSHETSGIWVQEKQADAAAIDSHYFEMLINQGQLNDQLLKKVWESEPFYHHPWVVRAALDDKIVQQLQHAFTRLEDQKLLAAFGASRFTTVHDDQYDEYRRLLQEAGVWQEIIDGD
jgi:phosphonate transport system substrate-binding protein